MVIEQKKVYTLFSAEFEASESLDECYSAVVLQCSSAAEATVHCSAPTSEIWAIIWRSLRRVDL